MPSFLTPDTGLLFWMLFAFLIVFIVLAKYGFPIIVNMVEERKKFIDESLKGAHEANEKLANIKIESEAILNEAREQQARILKEAMATRDSIVKEAKDKAQVEGNRLLEEAKIQIRVEKENAMRDIRAQVAELSVQVAEKVLRIELADANKQKDLLDRLLDEVSVSK